MPSLVREKENAQPEVNLRHKLDSGLEVIAEPIQGLDTVAVSWTFRTGFRDDPTGCGAGLTHVVEHAIFEASQAGGIHGVQYEAARLGVMVGAKTYSDTVQFTAVCEPDKLSSALNLLPTSRFQFTEKQFTHALTLVRTEIAESLARHQGGRELWVETCHELYTDWRYGHDGFGYHLKDGLDLYEAFEEHVATHFLPSNSTLVAVGGVAEDALLAELERLLPRAPRHDGGLVRSAGDLTVPESRGTALIRRSTSVVAASIDLADLFNSLGDYVTLLVCVELIKEHEQVLGVSLGIFGPFCSRMPETLTITLHDSGSTAESLSAVKRLLVASLFDVDAVRFQRATAAAAGLLAREARSPVAKSELIANLQVLFGGGSLAKLNETISMPHQITRNQLDTVAQRLLSIYEMAGA